MLAILFTEGFCVYGCFAIGLVFYGICAVGFLYTAVYPAVFEMRGFAYCAEVFGVDLGVDCVLGFCPCSRIADFLIFGAVLQLIRIKKVTRNEFVRIGAAPFFGLSFYSFEEIN